MGRTDPDDEARIDRNMRAQQAEEQARARPQDKVVTLPRRDARGAAAPAAAERPLADAEARVKDLRRRRCRDREGAAADHPAPTRRSIPKPFLKGARQAYEMIVTAFAEGNRKMLKDLLSREVYEGFVAAIADRESRGEQIDQSFVGINQADIVEAELKDGIAQLTVNSSAS